MTLLFTMLRTLAYIRKIFLEVPAGTGDATSFNGRSRRLPN
jgi:hypothetical protein